MWDKLAYDHYNQTVCSPFTSRVVKRSLITENDLHSLLSVSSRNLKTLWIYNELRWQLIINKKTSKCRKIPKISPGTYIFQRPFLRGLFLEGLIFGGAYVRREICVSKSIELACSGREIYHCFLCFTMYTRGNSNYKPPRVLYSERRFNKGFLR